MCFCSENILGFFGVFFFTSLCLFFLGDVLSRWICRLFIFFLKPLCTPPFAWKGKVIVTPEWHSSFPSATELNQAAENTFSPVQKYSMKTRSRLQNSLRISSRVIPGMFLRLCWHHCLHCGCHKVPCSGYDCAFSFCSFQISIACFEFFIICSILFSVLRSWLSAEFFTLGEGKGKHASCFLVTNKEDRLPGHVGGDAVI